MSQNIEKQAIVNLATKRIREFYKTREFLLSKNRTSDRTINLKQSLTKDFKDLDNQANIFRENYLTHGEINHYKVFRCRQSEVEDILYDMYIYSYAKALYSAMFYHNFNEGSNFGMCFQGHSQMFYLIKDPNFQDLTDGYFVTNYIHLGNESERRIFFALLIQQFPKLTMFSELINNFGFEPFIIPKMERYFYFLNEDYYAKNAGDESNETAGSDEFGRGRIKVTELLNSNCAKITSKASYPCLNSFYDRTEDNLICFSLFSHDAQDNNSLWLSKAIGLKISDEASEEVVRNSGYISISNNESLRHIGCSEVYAITGIRCKFSTTNVSSKRIFDPIQVDPDDLIAKVIKLIKENDSLDELVATILKSISDILEPEDVQTNNTEGK